MLTELRGRLDLSPAELAVLGTAELALGAYPEAELHLLRPHLAGEMRATVGYGAVLLEVGRWAQARAHLEGHRAGLSSDWAAEAQQVLATLDLEEGWWARAAERAEAAARDLLALGLERRAAGPLVTMAWACARQGQLARAEGALQIALSVLPEYPDPAERATALATLGWTQAVAGRLTEAQGHLDRASQLLSTEQVQAQRFVWAVRADVAAWTGDHAAEQVFVDRVAATLGPLTPPESRWARWVGLRRVALDRRAGQWSRALRALALLPPGAEALWQRGALLADLGEGPAATEALQAALAAFRARGQTLGEAQTLATLCRVAAGTPDAPDLARQALDAALRSPLLLPVRAVVDEVAAALADQPPSAALRAYLDAARTHAQPPAPPPTVQVQTLGGAQVCFAGQPVRAPAALLACLGLCGPLDRATLQLHLYPDRAPAAASSAVKQDIYRCRQALGPQSIVSEGAHHAKRYRLGPAYHWLLDVAEVLRGAASLDPVRAFGGLRGAFLPGVDSDWSRGVQAQVDAALEGMVPALLTVYRRERLGANMGHLVAQFAQAYPEHPRLAEFRALASGEGSAAVVSQ
ncbi:hypothetical protein [Deinococcus multiflagellatus]|uniref:Bacterial transcriptional activator domain-containing protein n=1 Tax=Deinococcus multiflagellatus TaxID=1656887 RepID=A0ABW1ZIV3_9DEIO|nr:hypothetical protein [Deinococcus multiflagellatus]MBZ9713097.1 hypothetical protein [Deinococcus multiflagellatus]